MTPQIQKASTTKTPRLSLPWKPNPISRFTQCTHGSESKDASTAVFLRKGVSLGHVAKNQNFKDLKGSPRLRSRCPRSSQACRPTRWRRACRLERKRRTAPSPSDPSACASAARHLYLRGWSWRMSEFSVRPLVPGRPDIILPAPGRNYVTPSKAELQGASRAYSGVIEGCLVTSLTEEFYFVIIETPWSNR